MKRHAIAFISILILITAIIATPTSFAHGLGKQRLERVEAGPFRLSAWTDPINIHANEELHVTVAIEDEEGLVLNASVAVRAAKGDQQHRQTATHDNAANKLHYEAPLMLDEAGRWTITIDVENDIGSGNASFDLDVKEPASTLPIKWILGGLAVLLLASLVIVNRLKSSGEGS